MKEDVARGYPGLEAWYLDTTSQPGKVLLRFGTLALNQSAGPLHILGRAGGRRRARSSSIYTATGAFVERPVAVFVAHQGHDHVHVAAFELYNLRDLKPTKSWPPAQSQLLPHRRAPGPSGGVDQTRPWPTTVPMGWNCGQYEQSINVGFSDYYDPAWPTSGSTSPRRPDGHYRLEVVID
ncbi:MAG: hypothetical protein R2854_03430 [Caldilineaceae bacterium]